MPNLSDLISISKSDSNRFKSIIGNEAEARSYGLTSDQLSVIKNMNPDQAQGYLQGIQTHPIVYTTNNGCTIK
ncbi:MAG: hypothetical protein ACM3SY_15860 [Candidatus Omnitrophota bacterium]